MTCKKQRRYLRFRESISDYGYYVDFDKIYSNVDKIKVELNVLNSLVSSKNIDAEFAALVERYPETLKCIPLSAIEGNFYSRQGLKLNETACSYKTLALEAKRIDGFRFVRRADGKGWNSARNDLEETFDVMFLKKASPRADSGRQQESRALPVSS